MSAEGLRATKLFRAGRFPRSESGRTYEVRDPRGRTLGLAARASRADAVAAVAAAAAGLSGWSRTAPGARTRHLLAVADAMVERRSRLEDEVGRAEGLSARRAAAVVEASVERWAGYAARARTLAATLGSVDVDDRVSVTVPVPLGVAVVVAPAQDSLLGLVSVTAPALAVGGTVVVLASTPRPLPAIALAEATVTAALPAGVLNVLTGPVREPLTAVATRRDLGVLDLTGVEDPGLALDVELAAADGTARVLPADPGADWAGDPGTTRLRALTRLTTVHLPVVG